MHLLDRYALSCGVKIDKPFVDESYFPITIDKYIVFQTSGKGNSRQYDYWPKVFSLIREYASEYKIIHVGIPTDQSVANVDLDLRGKTSIKQLAYVVKNSEMYLGVDSFCAHLGGYFDRKIVALYSYCYAQNCAPLFGSESNKTLIEVDWEKQGKPSFSLKEDPLKKKINTINPEIIAKAVLDKLGVLNDLDKFQTLHVGASYSSPVIEIVPDSGPYPSFISGKICNVRADWFAPADITLLKLASICKLNIITNIELPLDILNKIKNNVAGMTYIVNKDTSIEYLTEVKSIGINLDLTAQEDERWADLAEKFFEFGLEKEQYAKKSDIKSISGDNDKLFFSSEKIITAGGKVYANKLSWINCHPKLDKYSKVIDTPDFWQESEYFHIFKDERSNRSTITEVSPHLS
jgi:hypothetical protein